MTMRRPRARRFLSVFLRRRREATTVKEPEVFDVAHLEQMMRSRRWYDAERYLERFLLPVPSDERSPVGVKIIVDIALIKSLDKIAADPKEAASHFRKIPKSPFATRLKAFIAQMKSDETRPELLKIWHKIELERVGIILDLVARCPELQGDCVTVPPPERPITWVAAQHRIRFGSSRCKKKAAGRTPPPRILACAFLEKRLLSTERECQKPNVKLLDQAPQT